MFVEALLPSMGSIAAMMAFTSALETAENGRKAKAEKTQKQVTKNKEEQKL